MGINQEDMTDSGCTSDNEVKSELCPRIGNEYQVEVLEFMRSDNYVSFNLRSRLRMDEDSFSSQKKDAELDCDDKSFCSSYFSRANEWKDIECKSFVLGLYSFGKNLYLVKEFVETRSMLDVLSYYYGKFYKSTEYIRWSQSRKMEGSRIIKEDKIFVGWRQHELLSRISPYVSSDSEKSLKKVSRRFTNGKISLENYLFNLKGIIGITLLVEAVAIGKEKEDLTETTIHREKRTRKKPIGKAWTSLTEDVKGLPVDTKIVSIQSSFSGETEQGTIVVGQTFTTAACNADDSIKKVVLSVLSHDNEPLTEKSKFCSEIDLNQPSISPESGTHEPPTDDVHSSAPFKNSSILTETNNHFELLNSSNNATGEGQPVVKGQRRSCRRRELTTKALEAIALDLLGPKKRRKGKNSLSLMTDNVTSEIHCSSYLSEPRDHLELNFINDVTGKEKPAETCPRQSSKNRHLTTKALEAIALDFIGPEETKKGVNSLSRSPSLWNVRQKIGTAISHIDVASYLNQEMAHSDINVDGEFPI